MDKQSFSLETVYQIWDDHTGDRIEIGPERARCDFIEIRSYSDYGKISQRIALTREQLEKLQIAIEWLLV